MARCGEVGGLGGARMCDDSAIGGNGRSSLTVVTTDGAEISG
eukprot:SAG11_NODE_2540_length_3240_cov_5.748886_5_plen_42_part_00